MTPLDSNAECVASAAIRWAVKIRPDEMRDCVNRLSREEVLEVHRGLIRLQTAVLDRLQVTTDEAIAAHEVAEFAELVVMVVTAALSPDSLPDDMGDGFEINGRNG